MRVADYIAEFISRQGVEYVFMVSGGGMMFLSDGLKMNPALKVICNHHEQASAMAAVSYGKYTGNLGVAYVTTGCGGTNTITGVLDSWQDSVPCLFISGQSKRKETVRNSGLRLRQFGVQEADIIPIVSSITKYAVMVNEPNEIAYHLEKALYLAKSGRPGPAWIDVPLDVQGATLDAAQLRHFSPSELDEVHKEQPEKENLDELAKLIAKAKRPVIVAGQGIRIAGALDEFRAFIEKYNIPVVASRLGIDCLPSAHPLYIGRIGNKGDRAGNFTMQNADLVIGMGSRMSVSSTGHEYSLFAREAKVVIVDIDPVEHRKNTIRIDLFIESDIKGFLGAVSGGLPFAADAGWVAKAQEWKAKWPVCLPEYFQSERVNLYSFVEVLSKNLRDGSTVVSDAGSAFYVCSQGLRLVEGQRYITTGAQAEMGFTLPASIGASCARGKKEVIGVTGDGSFQMNIQELQTIIHNKLPIKIFVWNNEGYLSIRTTQRKFFEARYIGTDSESGVSFPDLELIANAYGLKFFRIPDTKHLETVIPEVLAHDGAALCEVVCIRDQEIVPTVTATKKEDGTLVSRPLEDMYPFLDRDEFRDNMIVKPLE